ncbi:MAG: hypothetical protein OXH90_03860 [Paracoccaceae bacterium]|nr:hypothetical protein [Paracoccaceae bacterium]
MTYTSQHMRSFAYLLLQTVLHGQEGTNCTLHLGCSRNSQGKILTLAECLGRI